MGVSKGGDIISTAALKIIDEEYDVGLVAQIIDAGDVRRLVRMIVDLCHNASKEEYPAIVQTLNHFEAIADIRIDIGLPLMHELMTLANEALAHDVCDRIAIWDDLDFQQRRTSLPQSLDVSNTEMMNMVVDNLATRLANGPPSLDVMGNVIVACPPCSQDALEKAERDLGFCLPQIMKQIYTDVANGGFGPGYGIMGVDGGFADDMNDTVVSLYGSYRQSDPEDPSWSWPVGWLPICHWGCIVYSVVDCTNAPYRVLFVSVGDREEGQPINHVAVESRPALAEWLDAWLAGVNLWDEVFK